MLHGREADEPAVGQHLVALGVAGEPRARHHLGGARLARHLHARDLRAPARPRRHHVAHAVADEPHRVGLEGEALPGAGQGTGTPPTDFTRWGRTRRPAVGHERAEPRELQGRDGDLALADGHRHRLPRVPGQPLDAQLPLRAGHQARGLVGQVDPGGRAQAELLPPGGEARDLQLDPELVEVDVARPRDGLPEVDDAVAPLGVAVADRPVDGVVAGAIDGGAGRDHALLEAGHRGHDLEGAARRVEALDDPVHEGGLGVGGELLPEAGLDAGGEAVGVVGGGRGEGQDLPRLGVEGHRAARAASEHRLRRLLQLRVEGEGERGAVLIGHALGLAHLQPAAVHDHPPDAVLPHEAAVVLGLEARLAHERPRLEPRELRQQHLPLRDLPHSTQGVGGGGGQRVGAQGHHLHAHLGQLAAPGLHRGHVPERGVGAQHDQLEGRGAAGQPLADLALPHPEHPRHPGHRLVEIAAVLGRGEDHVEGRPVLHQHPALPVEQRTARSGQGHGAGAVVVGQVPEVPRAHHLQVPEGEGDQAHERGHHRLHHA